MEVNFPLAGETDFIVQSIQCRGGPGTLYTVRITTRNFRTYAFFQLIVEQKVNTPSESPIRLTVKPKRVTNVTAPAFSSLGGALRDFLDTAAM